MKKPIVIDFETEGIEKRPKYPPKPVGVAIILPRHRPVYISWGHPSENDNTYETAKSLLSDIWFGKHKDRSLLFQNAPFDLEVAEKYFGLPYPSWDRIHDTMLLSFLYDPHSPTLSLKPMADRLLAMPPVEQDDLKDWIIAHVPEAKRAKKQWGKWICKAPGDLVGKYAKGDVIRTLKLFEYIMPKINKKAYDRERQVQPILVKAEQTGVRINKNKLSSDVKKFEGNLNDIDNKIRNILNSPELEIDKTRDLANAIDANNFVKEWPLTPKGQRSVAAKNLIECCSNKELVDLMMYRGRLKTGLRNFGRPWLELSYDGRMHSHWNQVVNEEGIKKYGARTGRLSSNPNLQNLADKIMSANLPHPREYIIPSKGNVLLGRDYMQQELRILAWKIGGELASMYQKNPTMDMHSHAQKLIQEISGIVLDRKHVKTTSFGIIYGMGTHALARALNTDWKKAATLRKLYTDALTGLENLQEEIKQDQEITTWGGRKYKVEPALTETRVKHVFGKGFQEVEVVVRDFLYKLLNYFVQGSAAECTKQAIINYDNIKEGGIFLLSAHDELLIECPKEIKDSEMVLLEEAMRDVNFNPVPMLSDGNYSYKNWAEMREYKI